MTREEYFDVIDLMRRDYSMLDIYKTKKSLDLADWVKQIFYLCNMAVKVKNVIDVDWQSMEMSLFDMFKLHRFSKKLNDDILSELSDVIPGMKDCMLPVREVKWHYGDEDDEDYEEDDDSGYYEDYHDDGSGFATRAAVLNLEVDGLNEMDFISDNEKTIVKEARDTANKILAEYQKMLDKIDKIEKMKMDYNSFNHLNQIKNYINRKGKYISIEDINKINFDIDKMIEILNEKIKLKKALDNCNLKINQKKKMINNIDKIEELSSENFINVINNENEKNNKKIKGELNLENDEDFENKQNMEKTVGMLEKHYCENNNNKDIKNK